MITIVAIVLTFGLILVFKKGYNKVAGTRKIEIGEISLSPVKPLNKAENIIGAFTSGLELKGFVTVQNLSKEQYTLSQINIDLLTPVEGKLLADQTSFMSTDKILTGRTSKDIPLSYNVDVTKILPLFKESQVLPEEFTVSYIIAHPLQTVQEFKLSNLKAQIKGFIEAEGITLNVNETINLYE